MLITEVRVKLVSGPKSRRGKLKAFCSVTFDDEFVVRDLKVIEGAQGLFIAMPSRKRMARCHNCSHKNTVLSRYCNDCGKRLPIGEYQEDSRRIYADIAHPIHAASRDKIHDKVVQAYHREVAASKEAGYIPQAYDDIDLDLVSPDRVGLRRERKQSRHRFPADLPGRQPPEEPKREIGASG
ncbi:MAG: stage V sporulation protein G [Planctomycetota bacterium]|nr:MAG: stage V sporulation protein G [Planctomycetota bacterium]